VLSAEEREYRLLCTRLRPDIHRDELARALAARETFAADFHFDRLLLSLDSKDSDAMNYLDVDFHSRPVAGAYLFAGVFAANPKLAEDMNLEGESDYRLLCKAVAALQAAGASLDECMQFVQEALRTGSDAQQICGQWVRVLREFPENHGNRNEPPAVVTMVPVSVA
jgi:hypothetical protein